MTTPAIRATLPDGRMGTAEGDLAPDLAQAQLSLDLAAAGERAGIRQRTSRPVFAIHEVKAAEADDLLAEWGHPLGGINPGKRGGRPFGYMAFVCEAPVARESPHSARTRFASSPASAAASPPCNRLAPRGG